jgi:hypothetical protein
MLASIRPMSIKSDHQSRDNQSPFKKGQAATSERREARRYAFICSAELMNVDGSMRISARTSDLSLTGCYIDTLNPFPVGTRVLLHLVKNNQRLEFYAEVTSCHMGSGMGLNFDRLTPAQVDTVVSWLDETSSPAEPPSRSQPSAAFSQTSADAQARFAARLVKILEHKGIVTHSEANELLRDLDS